MKLLYPDPHRCRPCFEYPGSAGAGPWQKNEVAQSCLTLCNPMDCSLPGFTVDGIFQARVLSGLPFPSPGDLPDPGIELRSPALQADALPAEPPGKPLQ